MRNQVKHFYRDVKRLSRFYCIASDVMWIPPSATAGLQNQSQSSSDDSRDERQPFRRTFRTRRCNMGTAKVRKKKRSAPHENVAHVSTIDNYKTALVQVRPHRITCPSMSQCELECDAFLKLWTVSCERESERENKQDRP